eukprot:gene13204-9455_t
MSTLSGAPSRPSRCFGICFARSGHLFPSSAAWYIALYIFRGLPPSPLPRAKRRAVARASLSLPRKLPPIRIAFVWCPLIRSHSLAAPSRHEAAWDTCASGAHH